MILRNTKIHNTQTNDRCKYVKINSLCYYKHKSLLIITANENVSFNYFLTLIIPITFFIYVILKALKKVNKSTCMKAFHNVRDNNVIHRNKTKNNEFATNF